jgi:hypothetical protein
MVSNRPAAVSTGLDDLSFHRQQPTLIVIQQQSLLSELLQQGCDLSVLELDDLLLTLIDHATECGEQDVAWLEDKGHVKLSGGDARLWSRQNAVFHGLLSSAEFFDPTVNACN